MAISNSEMGFRIAQQLAVARALREPSDFSYWMAYGGAYQILMAFMNLPNGLSHEDNLRVSKYMAESMDWSEQLYLLVFATPEGEFRLPTEFCTWVDTVCTMLGTGAFVEIQINSVAEQLASVEDMFSDPQLTNDLLNGKINFTEFFFGDEED